MNQFQVPDDFPREGPFSSISGTQSKFVARKINDRYVVGWTPEELRERYGSCEHLVHQLVEYVLRKAAENPDLTRDYIIEQVSDGVARKAQSREWDIVPEEQAWMMSRLKILLGW